MQQCADVQDHDVVMAISKREEELFFSSSTPRESKEKDKSPTVSPVKRETSQVLISASVHSSLVESGYTASNPSTPEIKQQLPSLFDLLLDHCESPGSGSNASTVASTPEMKPKTPKGPAIQTLFKKGPSVDAQFKRGVSRKQFRVALENGPDFDLLESPEDGSEVLLHVYEVGMFAPSVHKVLATLGTGAYHVGVEVYGKEFSYGQAQDAHCVTGLSVQHTPRVHPSHHYRFTERLGRTYVSPSQLKELIEELKLRWLARKYHTLRHNCVSFAEAFCAVLGVSQPPEHVGALAKGIKGILYGDPY